MDEEEPLLYFTSHIEGKNAQVAVYPDRLEWSWKGWLGTGAKAGMAFMTLGTSYLATGVRGKKEVSIIPVRSITHVSRRTSRLQDEVVVAAANGEIVMRVARAEADELIPLLLQLSQGTHPSQNPASPTSTASSSTWSSQAAAPPPPPPPPAAPPQPVLPPGMTWDEYYASPEYREWYGKNYPSGTT